MSFDQVFPRGCYLIGQVEPVRDFDRSTKESFVQSRDKDTGLPLWQVAVLDGDPTAKAAQRTMSIKIPSAEEPEVPDLPQGHPIMPVEIVGLTVTPYVAQSTGRLAYSIRATAIRRARVAASGGGE
ncbi:plasmid replication, integration and excision activator [Nonomuraea sediminis]|uniref:plasmid replication, integration and excision activator n=1 Tax=Nonomuraea sediminis TaxID=2835864 RepID=UPI0027E17149|nr:plasmid replication, integration and excision activator [Nonomuraea sediminis]